MREGRVFKGDARSRFYRRRQWQLLMRYRHGPLRAWAQGKEVPKAKPGQYIRFT
jgi:hypothetical protein